MKETVDKLVVVLGKIERLVDSLNPSVEESPDFERYLAFRWEQAGKGGRLAPIAYPHLFDLNELVGIDQIRDDVLRNTEQFVSGLPANNVLLWGERGCGKSSLVKGLLQPFAGRGLRIVELKRWDIMALPRIVSLLRGADFRFILFCDDLSFDDGEGDFRALKTLLDGDMEERPDNVLIYATSNRRHLMPEKVRDTRGDDEIHPEEAEGEKLALADRFGLSYGFYRFDQQEYLAIVQQYAARRNLPLSCDELCDQALKWAMFTAKRSGRSARQFIDDLEGRLKLADRRNGNPGINADQEVRALR